MAPLRTLLIPGARSARHCTAKRTAAKSGGGRRWGSAGGRISLPWPWPLSTRGFSGRCWPEAKSIGEQRKPASLDSGEIQTHPLLNDLPLAARKNDGMDNWSDRRTVSPSTLEVHRETGDGMGAVRAHDHQGWSKRAHHQAGYRRAVRPLLTISSTPLAPPGASIEQR